MFYLAGVCYIYVVTGSANERFGARLGEYSGKKPQRRGRCGPACCVIVKDGGEAVRVHRRIGHRYITALSRPSVRALAAFSVGLFLVYIKSKMDDEKLLRYVVHTVQLTSLFRLNKIFLSSHMTRAVE